MTKASAARELAATGLTQTEIAERLNVSRQAVSKALKTKPGPKVVRCDLCVCKVCGGTWEPRRKRARTKGK